jgi:hypothetical protein
LPGKRTSAFLKIINGSAAHDPGRRVVDVPVRGKPKWPECADPPNEQERAWFAYLARLLPTEFGESDSVLIAHCARVSAQLEKVEKILRERGSLIHGTHGVPVVGAHHRVARNLREEQRSCLSKLGLNPQDRLALSRRSENKAIGKAWKDFE